MAHTHTSTPQAERSLQAGGHLVPGECTLNDVEIAEASLDEVPTTISPIAVTPGSRSSHPSHRCMSQL